MGSVNSSLPVISGDQIQGVHEATALNAESSQQKPEIKVVSGLAQPILCVEITGPEKHEKSTKKKKITSCDCDHSSPASARKAKEFVAAHRSPINN